MNKKGNFPDVIEWIRVAVGFGFVLAIALIIATSWNTNIQAMNETTMPNQSKNASTNWVSSFDTFDYGFVLILIAFVAFSFMAARLIPSSPKFIIISIISLILVPFIAMMVENIWDSWYNQSTINTLLSTHTMPVFLLNHLTVVALLYSALIAVALLTKERDQ